MSDNFAGWPETDIERRRGHNRPPRKRLPVLGEDQQVGRQLKGQTVVYATQVKPLVARSLVVDDNPKRLVT